MYKLEITEKCYKLNNCSENELLTITISCNNSRQLDTWKQEIMLQKLSKTNRDYRTVRITDYTIMLMVYTINETVIYENFDYKRQNRIDLQQKLCLFSDYCLRKNVSNHSGPSCSKPD